MPGIIMSTIAASNGIVRASSSPSAACAARRTLVALARQQRLEDLAHDLLVVDDQDGAVASHGSHARLPYCWAASRRSSRVDASGSASVNRVPCPIALSQVIVPPCSWTMP